MANFLLFCSVVRSFISQFSSANPSKYVTPAPSTSTRYRTESASYSSPQPLDGLSQDSPPARSRIDRPPSRPMSMVQPYHPPLMEVGHDTPPELQPIFSFLNSHSN